MANPLKTAVRQATKTLGLYDKIREHRVANAGAVTIGAIDIPPAHIRLGGHNFQRDRDFLDAAIRDARRLEENLGISVGSSVLDIGCGVGRLPIGLRAHFGALCNYTGVDVDASVIRWCREHISGSNVAFVHLDLANERYNPSGTRIDEGFRLPLGDASFEAIHLYSVFSHMETGDVAAYLREFRRLLTPAGSVFLTAFVEEGVEDMAINPAGYGEFPGEWDGALHCVRFARAFFDDLVQQAGMEIYRFDHASDTDGQSAIFLRRNLAASL